MRLIQRANQWSVHTHTSNDESISRSLLALAARPAAGAQVTHTHAHTDTAHHGTRSNLARPCASLTALRRWDWHAFGWFGQRQGREAGRLVSSLLRWQVRWEAERPIEIKPRDSTAS